MEASGPSSLRLHLVADLPVPEERAFEALTDPNDLRNWWGPRDFTIPMIELDLQVGGRYRFAMQPPEGAPFHLQGRYLEIDAPHGLGFTFRWEEPDPEDVETVVALALLDLGASTRLTVDQGPFGTEPRRQLHERGWSESLQKLESLLSSA